MVRNNMADFDILVGAQAEASFTQLQSDITQLFEKVNKPLQIKVEVANQAAVTNLRNDIEKAYTAANTNAAQKTAQQSAQAAKTRAAAEQQVTSALNQQAAAESKVASASKQSTSSATQDTKAQIARTNAIKQYYTTLMQLEKAVDSYTAAEKSRNTESRSAYAEIKQTAEAMRGYESAVHSASTSTDEIRAKTAAANAVLKQQTATLKTNGDATKTIGERIGSLVGKFSSWLTISQAVMLAVNSVRQMVSASIELDTAMTELKKVTNETDATYATFLENASTRATQIGTSLSDIVSATADFARLGYNIEDASGLADAASIYLNVGDDLDSISDASESIISTMQAFGIEASDAMSVVDKFNEVSNNYAISSGGLGEALQRSAAAMSAANNTLDETIALTTAANTIVQDPDSVGTTLKTVSMYLRAAKTEAEEAGESTEGMASSVSELREELLSLTNNKVDIQIDEDTFKSTYQILKELSEVWDDLSDIDQANITEMVGGKRNANVVTALLENFDIAEAALKTSSDSAGSALSENEKYLDSIQGKLDIMKASFQALSADFMESSSIKAVITGLTGVLNALDAIVKTLGGIPTAVGAIGIVALIKNFGSSNEFALYGCEPIAA